MGVRKKEVEKVLVSFVLNHIEAGNFWEDETYAEEVKALAYMGYEKAAEVSRRLYYK